MLSHTSPTHLMHIMCMFSCGYQELIFIRNSGAYMGGIFGLIQMLIWIPLHNVGTLRTHMHMIDTCSRRDIVRPHLFVHTHPCYYVLTRVHVHASCPCRCTCTCTHTHTFVTCCTCHMTCHLCPSTLHVTHHIRHESDLVSPHLWFHPRSAHQLARTQDDLPADRTTTPVWHTVVSMAVMMLVVL